MTTAKKANEEDLRQLELKTNGNNFSLWMKDKKTGKRYWLLDGSCLEKDAIIRLLHPMKKFEYAVEYVEKAHALKIIKRK